jgi:hypothetical protein
MHTSRPARGHRRTLLAALIGTLLLAPACTASEDTTPDRAPTADTPTVEQETLAPDAGETEVSEAPDAEPTDDVGEEGGDAEIAGIDLNAEYCELARQAEEAGLFSGAGPQTPEDLAMAAEQARTVAHALARQAPDEIADDVELSANNLSDLLSVLEAHASRTGEVGDEMQDDPEVRAAMEALESPEVQEAHDRVDEWEKENC